MKKIVIHAWSLVLGGLFRSSYRVLGSSHYVTTKSLEAYRSTRRKLPGQTKGPNGRSTRFGASEAHETTQD